jgi:exodeoxyribonuclease VII small subunit
MANKELTIEEKFSRLEELVSKLENEKMTLKESLSLYEEAMNLSKELNTSLNEASKQVLLVQENNKLEKFEDEK